METYKIQQFTTKQLNHAEVWDFNHKVLSYATQAGTENILTEDILPEFSSTLDEYVHSLNQSKASSITPMLKDLDTERITLVTTIFNKINEAKNSLHSNEREAYNVLHIVIRPIKDIKKFTLAEKSTAIESLVIDLNADKNKTYVSAILLNEYVAKINEINDKYIQLSEQRTAEKPEKSQSSDLRNKLENMYQTIVNDANSLYTVHKSDITKNFIREINNLINETKTMLNHRKADHGKGE